MTDISVKNLIKAFEEGKNILDGLSFDIHEGERVGILGKNGAGKTTLFNILAGTITSDEGEIAIGSGKRLGLISQIPVFPPEYTTEDVLKSAQERLSAMRKRMEKLEKLMGEDHSKETLSEYDKLAEQFRLGGGYDMDMERNKVANGLEISASMRSQLFETLSGGEKTRVNLARLILENTDILLLDEPTNHLDIRATEWLEDYLNHFKGTVLAISHDRYFLDNAITRIIEITGGKAEFYNGNYSFYVTEKQARFEEQKKRYEKEQSEAKRLKAAADRLAAWGTGNKRLMQKSQAIEKRMQRILKTERPKSEKTLHARFGEREFFGDEALTVRDLSKSYDGRMLFSGIEFEVKAGERIALIGDNGTGKSTLIKVLIGEETPDRGYIRFGPSVKKAYLPQVVNFKHPHLSVLDTMVVDENMSPQAARNRLGAFKFSGEDVYKQVSSLSGGEKSRLRLCALMKDDINLLILDEPTNHLDIASREWIEEALDEYEEALIFVSHDRYFIDRFATRIWEIREGGLIDFNGGYDVYRQMMTSNENVKPRENKKPTEKKKKTTPANTEKLRLAAEKEIAALEEKIRQLDLDTETFGSDYEKLSEIFAQREETELKLDAVYERWAGFDI